jgi:hypothetical protein
MKMQVAWMKMHVQGVGVLLEMVWNWSGYMCLRSAGGVRAGGGTMYFHVCNADNRLLTKDGAVGGRTGACWIWQRGDPNKS